MKTRKTKKFLNFSYANLTIEGLEKLYQERYEIICDADNLVISIK